MQTKKQARLKRAIICLLLVETFIAICEIALALYYVIEGRGFAVSISEPMQKTIVVLMVVVYFLILGILLSCLLVFLKSKSTNKQKLCLSAILVVEGAIVFYLLYTIVNNLIGNPNDTYFLLSLSWNIPRIILSTSLLLYAALYKKRYMPVE